MLPGESHPGTATIREVITLVEQVRRDGAAEIKVLAAEIQAKLAVHETEHEVDRKERRGLYRWAVTTIMTGGGVLVALWVALRGP